MVVVVNFGFPLTHAMRTILPWYYALYCDLLYYARVQERTLYSWTTKVFSHIGTLHTQLLTAASDRSDKMLSIHVCTESEHKVNMHGVVYLILK